MLAAHHEEIKGFLDQGLTVVKIGELLARRAWWSRAEAAPVRAGGPGPRARRQEYHICGQILGSHGVASRVIP